MAMTLRNLPALLFALAAVSASASQHAFDFAAASFRSHVRRLQKPLTGSTSSFDATGEVRTRKVLSGLAEVEQAFSADGGKTWEVNWIADAAASIPCRQCRKPPIATATSTSTSASGARACRGSRT